MGGCASKQGDDGPSNTPAPTKAPPAVTTTTNATTTVAPTTGTTPATTTQTSAPKSAISFETTTTVAPTTTTNATTSTAAPASNNPAAALITGGDEEIVVREGIRDYYTLGDEIGRGGFSVVVRGTDKKTGNAVAIKCIQLAIQDADAVTSLQREIRIMRKIDHPNILRLYEVFVEDDDFYLVMELIEGKELFEKIVEKQSYSEKDASNIMRQIVAAIEYLHDNGIAHRDLKPENLLSIGDGDNERVKLIDFGLSKRFGDEQLVTSVGSPGYVAPEVLTAETYDKSVDMWSLGVILYILLSGYPPFFADTSTELFKKIIDVSYDFEDPIWEQISEAPKNIIRNLLVKDPSKRLTAKAVLQDSWVKGETAADKQIGTTEKMSTNMRRLTSKFANVQHK
eukprot:TRINITY_DN359_c0_g1_i6.p1 TRINITY_DN359_c0_g1~~TRINITY_DN359_c0_g1_i6.p1  ORF type:complete len:397 (+),score=208.50 TRINITY_DN359_c0_g1_i6:196-1386(+)